MIPMKFLFGMILLTLVLGLKAQNEINTPFIQHLVNRGDYREALFLLNKVGEDQAENYSDSIHYLKGWAHYSLKELTPSTASFLKVNANSNYYLKSHFFAGYNQIHLSDYSQATTILNGIRHNGRLVQPLKELQLAGIDLLNHRYSNAETRLALIDSTYSPLHQPLINLKLITADMKLHRSKSPLLAGVMSAIIPGSGKIYAGKTGQGISTFISTIGFGLITWENYRKLGPAHIKTIAFGAAFAGNYLSNIYGSAVAAKIVEDEYKSTMHNQILFNLHIPLRNIFE